MVGELENKLVLMSTELMRLGNLSRGKVHDNNQLHSQIKELLLRNEHLEKDLLERERTIVNYREELRLLEHRLSNIAISESRLLNQKETQDQGAYLK